MSAVAIALGMLVFLGLGYHFYGRFVEHRLAARDDSRSTPALAQRDGVDYEPANPIVLFGHHFSSIAGVGPVVGPILGMTLFGWAPVLGWIAFGSIFVGGVHDYLSLVVSIRNRGGSLAEVSGRVVSPAARRVFAIFLWLALVLVIAVFASAGTKALMAPELGAKMVFPTLMVIPIAMVLGVCVRRRLAPLWLLTTTAVGAALYCIYVGNTYLPMALPATLGPRATETLWFVILMLYCVVASTLPVWLLLQPRDYISVFKLFIGLVLGYAGLFAAHPSIQAPAWLGLSSPQGPIWPMLFVIVACGAVSGFHSVVASGTTSKQLATERHGRAVTFGTMVLEGVLAVLTVCLVGGGLMWAAGAQGDRLYAPDIIVGGGGGPLTAFARGFGQVVGGQAFRFIGAGLAGLFGMVMLKTFTLTTLDTCTRLARFVVTEQFGQINALFRNRLIATLITIVPAFILLYSGAWNTIWPVFGAANQLIAALALMVIACYLLGCRRPSIYAIVPGVFMLLTTLAALVLQIAKCATHVNDAGQPAPQWVLIVFSAALIALALFVTREVWTKTEGLRTCPCVDAELCPVEQAEAVVLPAEEAPQAPRAD